MAAQAPKTRRALAMGAAAGWVTGAAGLAACAGGPAQIKGGEAAPPLRAGTVLQVLNWTTGEVARAQQLVMDRFTAQHPQVTVRFAPVALATYWDRLAAQQAAGMAPDVAWMNPQNFGHFASEGRLLNLGPLLKRDRVDLTDFWPGAVQRFSYRGSPHALPSNYDGRAFFYNKTLFDRAGVSHPPGDYKDASWTPARLLEVAQRLTSAESGTWGVCVPSGLFHILPWIWSAGGDLLNRDRSASVVTSRETVNAFQFLADLVHRYRVAPTPADLRMQGELALFQSGKLGVVAVHSGNVKDGRSVNGFEWDAAPLVRGTAGPAMVASGPAWIVPTASRNPEEAWALTTFLAAPEAQTQLSLAGGGFARKSVAEAVYRNMPPPPKNARVFVEGMAYTRPDPFTARWPEIEQVMNEELTQLWEGTRPARETMAAVKTRVDVLLKLPDPGR